MANTEITVGIFERIVYGAIIAATAKLVEKGYMTSDMAAYVAGGGMAALGSVWAWWQNRPGRLLDRAAAQIPVNGKLVITVPVHASAQDKDAAHDLARSAGENVVAKVAI